MELREAAFGGTPLPVPVIDAHTHLMGYFYNGWYTAQTSTDNALALMDRLGIDCIVTAPHSLLMGDIDEANRAAQAAARQYPGKVYGYISIWPQGGVELVKQTLEQYAGDPAFLGLKLLAGYHGPLASPGYDYALDFAQEAGCPVVCHIWQNNPMLRDVERAVRTRPTLKLIMAHQGGGYKECTEEYAALMREYPNLHVDTCGSLFNQLSMEELVELAGEERVIFGTDMINLDPRYDFGRVALSTLADDVKRRVFAENYLQLLEGSNLGRITLQAGKRE